MRSGARLGGPECAIHVGTVRPVLALLRLANDVRNCIRVSVVPKVLVAPSAASRRVLIVNSARGNVLGVAWEVLQEVVSGGWIIHDRALLLEPLQGKLRVAVHETLGAWVHRLDLAALLH